MIETGFENRNNDINLLQGGNGMTNGRFSAGRGVNLEKLAARLGLSKGTVSRALNGYPDISERTKIRVRQAAEELGYSPSRLAQRLATGRVETVGYILPLAGGHLANPFLAEFIDGISEALGERDLDLLVATAPDRTQELERYARLIDQGKVDGLIVSRLADHDPRVDLLMARNFPFVAFGRTADPTGYAWLDIDNEQAFRSAVAHLVSQGHQVIGLLSGPEEMNFARLRREGYTAGLIDAGLDPCDTLVVEGDISEAGGHDLAAALLTRRPRPTALLCCNDAMAFGALRAIREAGLRPGADVSVIGYDGTSVGAYVDPPLTTLAPPIRRAGRRLAEMLIEIVAGAAPTDFQELWEARLVRRASDVPCRPQNA